MFSPAKTFLILIKDVMPEKRRAIPVRMAHLFIICLTRSLSFFFHLKQQLLQLLNMLPIHFVYQPPVYEITANGEHSAY